MKLPPRLLKIIRRCLESDPEKRYQNASEIIDDLKLFNTGVAQAEDDFIAQNLFGQEKNDEGKSRVASKSNDRKPIIVPMIIGGTLFTIVVIYFLLSGPRIHNALVQQNENAVVEMIPETIQSTLQNDTVRVSYPSSVKVTSTSTVTQENAPKMNSSSVKPLHKVMTFENNEVADVEVYQQSPALNEHSKENKKNVTDTATIKKSVAEELNRKEQSVRDTLNGFDILKTKYGTENRYSIVVKAIQQKSFNDAQCVLNAIPDSLLDVKKKSVLQLELFIETERYVEAKKLMDGSEIDAMEFYYLSGRVALFFGNYGKAAGLFERAMQVKCLIPERRRGVLDNLIYYSAVTSQKRYEEDRSVENLDAARSAWQSVKDRFTTAPLDSRYQQAIEVLSKL